MFAIPGKLAETSIQLYWMHLLCDAALLAACVLMTVWIGRRALARRPHRTPVLFWILGAVGLVFGLLQLARIHPASLSADGLYATARMALTGLLWVDTLLLLRWFRRAGFPTHAELEEQLDQRMAAYRRREEELNASRLRTIFDNARDVIIYVDTRGRFLDVNKRVEDVFGYKPEELIGRRFTRVGILRLKDIPRVARLFRQTILSDKATELVELELKHKNGSSVFVEVGTRFVRRNGKVKEVVNIFRDITERKQAMAELAAAKQAAESASMAKSEFLANMSHEIRTPLTAIVGFADVLRQNLAKPEDLEAANTIRRNGNHLLSVINDILDLSKIEAGKLPIQKAACSPVQIVAEVVSLMRVRAAGKHLTLATEFVGPIPAAIRTDPTRLRQILFNLIGNALKFTEAGSVRLVVRLAKRPSGESGLQFDVIDTGVGMSEEEVSRLFQPFTQGDMSSQRPFGGTGLGLAITKRLATMLGGEITVQSRPQKGSTFSVVVDPGPLDDVAMLDCPHEAAVRQSDIVLPACRPPMKLSGRILLVEDGLDNQRLISLLLQTAGMEATIAENGQVACEKVAAAMGKGDSDDSQPQFDVILMDIQMPVMDGYQATRLLRQAGCTAPIIALTAHAMADDRQKCFAAGCDDYVSKPVNREKLLSTIARHLERARDHRTSEAAAM